MARALLVINSSAGRVSGLKNPIDDLYTCLSPVGELDAAISESIEELGSVAREAVRAEFDIVIAAGGDGTINEIVNAAACSSVTIGIIPLGTANVIARELNIPIDDIPAACSVVVSGASRRIDLGCASGRWFAAMAGFGFDAAVVHSVDQRAKKVIGVGAYAIAVTKELAKLRPVRYSLYLDDSLIETEASVILVSNSACYAYGIKVAADAKIDDGLLDVVIFEKSKLNRIGFLWQSALVLMGARAADFGVKTFRAKKVVVRSVPNVLMHLDGDEWGSTPADVEIVPCALTVKVPASR
jgi:YegS/Rv2252/BmrU family lipid kinase